MIRYKRVLFLLVLMFAGGAERRAIADVRVAPPRTDIPYSTDYDISVSTKRWGNYKPSHVHFTRNKYYTYSGDEAARYEYQWALRGYRMSFINFEFNAESWVKVRRKDGGNIDDFVIKPNNKGAWISYRWENGQKVAIVRINNPSSDYYRTPQLALVRLKSNGEEDRAHAIGLFGSPYFSTPTSNVVRVQPGDPAPSWNALSAGQTVVFEPGLHSIGINYPLKSNVDYFLHNGAYLRGTFSRNQFGLRNINLKGLGVVSADSLWRRFEPNGMVTQYGAFRAYSCDNVNFNGPTFVDFPYHTINHYSSNNGWNRIENIKILNWRIEGDGVHMFGNGEIRDCFVRSQDDSFYIASIQDNVNIYRVTTWNDHNGSAFIFSAGGGGSNTNVFTSDILFNRKPWAHAWNGGSIFALRHLDNNAVVENITLTDIRIHDPAPSRGIFQIIMDDPKNSSDWNYQFKNIVFRDITAVAQGPYPNTMRGRGSLRPRNILFDQVYIGGSRVTNFNGWSTNDLDLGEFTFK